MICPFLGLQPQFRVFVCGLFFCELSCLESGMKCLMHSFCWNSMELWYNLWDPVNSSSCNLRLPAWRKYCHKFVSWPGFDSFIGMIILANGLTIGSWTETAHFSRSLFGGDLLVMVKIPHESIYWHNKFPGRGFGEWLLMPESISSKTSSREYKALQWFLNLGRLYWIWICILMYIIILYSLKNYLHKIPFGWSICGPDSGVDTQVQARIPLGCDDECVCENPGTVCRLADPWVAIVESWWSCAGRVRKSL